MNMVVFRRCQSALGVAAVMALALVASLVFAAMPAAAVTLSRADAGTFLRYEHGGEQVIGVMAKDSTNNYYCIEADERVEYQLGESVKLRDDDTARRLGWLMDHYRDGTAVEHAAIAVLAHDLLDLKPDTWKSRRVSVMRDNPTLRRKVEQMWEEAGSNAPANATVTRTYAEGTRTGRVTVSVTNAQGKTIAGIRYAATLNGPAVFANGSATVTGISGAEPIVYSWKATGEGEVKASVAYDRKQVDVFAVAGGQDLVRYGGSSQVSGKAVNFSVRKEFVPTLGTPSRPRWSTPGSRSWIPSRPGWMTAIPGRPDWSCGRPDGISTGSAWAICPSRSCLVPTRRRRSSSRGWAQWDSGRPLMARRRSLLPGSAWT